MMAFCTVLESESNTTRSNGLSCASSRLPKTLRITTRKAYTTTGRRIFSATGTPTAKIWLHMPLEIERMELRQFPFAEDPQDHDQESVHHHGPQNLLRHRDAYRKNLAPHAVGNHPLGHRSFLPMPL